MQSKLSDLVDNLSEIDTKGCKTWMERKISNQNVSLLNLKLIDWIADVKNAREYQRNTKSIKGLIKKFPNIYQFCNGDLNKLVLLLRKEVYPYEYTDSWERFNVTSLPNIMDKMLKKCLKNLVIIMACMFKLIIIACRCFWKI